MDLKFYISWMDFSFRYMWSVVCDIKKQLQDAFGNNQTLHWEDKITNRWYLASKTLCPCFCFLFLLPKPRLFYGRGRRSTWLAQLGNRRSTEQEFGSRLDFLVFSDKDEKRPGVLAIMPYTGRLRPKGVPFSGHRYSQLSLRRTPLGPALSVRLREMSVL